MQLLAALAALVALALLAALAALLLPGPLLQRQLQLPGAFATISPVGLHEVFLSSATLPLAWAVAMGEVAILQGAQ